MHRAGSISSLNPPSTSRPAPQLHSPCPVRAYSLPNFDVSTFRRFCPKTTQIASRPNPSPPQHLPPSPKTFFAYCHFRTCSTYARSTKRLAVWRRPTSGPCIALCYHSCSNLSAPHHPRPQAAGPPNFDVSIFGRFHRENHPNRASPQHMPAAGLANEKIRVCHHMSPTILLDLRAGSATASTLNTSAPRSLGPISHFMSPSALRDLRTRSVPALVQNHSYPGLPIIARPVSPTKGRLLIARIFHQVGVE